MHVHVHAHVYVGKTCRGPGGYIVEIHVEDTCGDTCGGYMWRMHVHVHVEIHVEDTCACTCTRGDTCGGYIHVHMEGYMYMWKGIWMKSQVHSC